MGYGKCLCENVSTDRFLEMGIAKFQFTLRVANAIEPGEPSRLEKPTNHRCKQNK